MRVLYFGQGYTSHDHRFLAALAKTEHELRVHHCIRLEDIQVDVIVILGARRVVRVALHQDKLLIDLQDRMHRPLNVGNIGRPGRNDHRLSL